MRIAIVGVGAIGSVIAGALFHSGRHEVILCARRPFSRIRITAPGGVFEYPASSALDPREVPRCDWILLCTKAHQVESASEWIRAARKPGSKLAVLQNGVDHADRVRSHAEGVPIVPYGHFAAKPIIHA